MIITKCGCSERVSHSRFGVWMDVDRLSDCLALDVGRLSEMAEDVSR